MVHVFEHSNYPMKLWLFWQCVIFITSIAGYTNICVAAAVRCNINVSTSAGLSMTYYSVLIFVILFFCYKRIGTATTNTNTDNSNHMRNNIHSNCTLFKSNYSRISTLTGVDNIKSLSHLSNTNNKCDDDDDGKQQHAQMSNTAAINDSITPDIFDIIKYASSILMIVNSVITATSTMSLYFVIEENINDLEKKYPFVKYSRSEFKRPHPAVRRIIRFKIRLMLSL